MKIYKGVMFFTRRYTRILVFFLTFSIAFFSYQILANEKEIDSLETIMEGLKGKEKIDMLLEI